MPPPPVTPDVHWLERPLWPCTDLPQGRPGTVAINGTLYAVMPLVEDLHTYGFVLCRDGLKDWYQVQVEGWVCSCPDATFRQRECKHSYAIRLLGSQRP